MKISIPPGPGEVLIRLVATGVCHSDVTVCEGKKSVKLPIVLGHEGAGRIEAAGPEVHGLELGDHVVLAVSPRCGRCEPCVIGQPYRCRVAGPVLYEGALVHEVLAER